MAAAREVMLGMLRMVWMLTDIATMISPASAAAAPAVATKNLPPPTFREGAVMIGHPARSIAQIVAVVAGRGHHRLGRTRAKT